MASAKAIVFDLIASDHASRVFEKVGAAAEASATEVESAQRKIGKAQDANTAKVAAFNSAFKKAMLGAAGAAALFGAASVKMAGDFQKQMTLLVTGAGESQKNIKAVSDGILNLAGSTGTSASELAKAMYLIESAGNHGAKGLLVLKAAAQGAKADGADLSTVADALTTVLNDLGDKAVKAAGGVPTIMSQMVAAVAAGKMRMDDFAGSIHNFLPNAQALGIKFSEAAAAMATMTAEGISADQASQNLNHALLHLASPTLAQTKAMAAYGLSATDVAKNLGKRGLAGTLQLLEDAVAKHMGPAGLTIVNTFNKSKEAAADAAKMYGALPVAGKRVADELKNGSVSLKTWTEDVKALPAPIANLVKQWAATQNASKGFNQMLRSGSPAAQTFSGAMRALTGDATGLQVALHLGGDHMATFEANTRKIGAATADAQGNVKDWAAVQKNFNQTMDRAKEALDAFMIRVGTKLLPWVQKFVQATMDAVGWVSKWASEQKGMLPFLATFAGVIGTVVLAMKAWKTATEIYTAAQLALNVALDANPIGIVVVAIAALVAGFVTAYKESTTFRNIVNETWKVISAAISGTWNDTIKPILGLMADLFLSTLGSMIGAAAKVAGFLHLPFANSLKNAAAAVKQMKDSINASMADIQSPAPIVIKISDGTVATIRSLTGADVSASRARANVGKNTFADGGQIYGPGGPRDDVIPIMASNGEYIVNAASTSQYLPVLEAINAGRFADGGLVGVQGAGSTASSIRRDVSYLNAGLSAAAQHIGSVIASKVQAVMASAGPVIGGSVSGNVSAYKGVVAQALQMLGQSPALIPAVLRRMRLESGGNPSVVNKWDSNWKAGTPSVGLMQVIGPTFRSYAGPFRNIGPFSYGVSTSALANVYAGLNYALHRYGSIGAIDPLVHPGGYANGGLVRHVRTAAGARRYHLPIGSVIPSGSRSSSSAGRSSSSRSGGPMVLSAAQWNSVATALDRIRGGGTSVSAFSNGLASILKKFMTGGALDQALALLRRQDREWLAYTKAHSVIVARVSAAQKQLASTVQARSQYAQQVASNLSSMGDLTGAFSNATTDGATAGQVKGYLSTQLASLSRFGGNLGALRRLGLSPALIGQLADAGVSGGGMTADVLAHSSKADIARINRLESQIGNVSRNIGNATAAAKYDGSISSIKSNLSRLEHQEKRAADSLQHLATDMARSVVHELRSNHVRVHVSV